MWREVARQGVQGQSREARSLCRSSTLLNATRYYATTSSSSSLPRVGWIGTGVMGASMCGHLVDAGYPVTAYSRTLAKTEGLAAKGARIVSSPAEVAKTADIVFTIVALPKDVREVILGDNGVLANCKEGDVIVDMTTSEPSLALEINKEAKKKGVYTLDAPVSGGDIGAKEARLSIMVGGDKEPLERVRPLFERMGKNIQHMGPASAGQHTKMVNQILISTTMIGMVEGLMYAHKAGLDLETAIKAVGGGAAGSWSINNYGPRIIKRNFDPGFYVEHFIKDMGIALSEAERMNLKLPGLELAHNLYKTLQSQGHGRKGTHSLVLAFEELNKYKMTPPSSN